MSEAETPLIVYWNGLEIEKEWFISKFSRGFLIISAWGIISRSKVWDFFVFTVWPQKLISHELNRTSHYQGKSQGKPGANSCEFSGGGPRSPVAIAGAPASLESPLHQTLNPLAHMFELLQRRGPCFKWTLRKHVVRHGSVKYVLWTFERFFDRISFDKSFVVSSNVQHFNKFSEYTDSNHLTIRTLLSYVKILL